MPESHVIRVGRESARRRLSTAARRFVLIDRMHALRHAHPLDMSARPRPVAPAGDEFGRNPIA